MCSDSCYTEGAGVCVWNGRVYECRYVCVYVCMYVCNYYACMYVCNCYVCMYIFPVTRTTNCHCFPEQRSPVGLHVELQKHFNIVRITSEIHSNFPC